MILIKSIMHSERDNIKVMINDEAEEVIKEYISLSSITFIYCIINIIK